MYLFFVELILNVNIENILKQFIVSLLKATNPRKHIKNQEHMNAILLKFNQTNCLFLMMQFHHLKTIVNHYHIFAVKVVI